LYRGNEHIDGVLKSSCTSIPSWNNVPLACDQNQKMKLKEIGTNHFLAVTNTSTYTTVT
jgi:hypothetical protein